MELLYLPGKQAFLLHYPTIGHLFFLQKINASDFIKTEVTLIIVEKS